eukprot:719118-Prymnesium_polylepis.1
MADSAPGRGRAPARKPQGGCVKKMFCSHTHTRDTFGVCPVQGSQACPPRRPCMVSHHGG